MSRAAFALAAGLALVATPLAAQSCLGGPPAPGSAGAVLTPTLGGAGGGTEMGLVAGYAHTAGAGVRGRFASTRFGSGEEARSEVGAELAYDVAGWVLPANAPAISLCPGVGLARMSIGSLGETSFRVGVSAGGAVALTEAGDWTLHPYGTLGYLRAARSFETLRRTESGAAVRGGVLVGYGRFVGGVEAEHGSVFAADPAFRIRLGIRL